MNKRISKFRTLFCAAMLSSMVVSSTHANPGSNKLAAALLSRIPSEKYKDVLTRIAELAKQMGVKATGWVADQEDGNAYANIFTGKVRIARDVVRLPNAQRDFLLAHELGHLQQSWSLHSLVIFPLLIQTSCLLYPLFLLARGGRPNVREWIVGLAAATLLTSWGSRTREYDADARAVRTLQSTQGGIAWLTGGLEKRKNTMDPVGNKMTILVYGFFLDKFLYKLICNYYERQLIKELREHEDAAKLMSELPRKKIMARGLSVGLSLGIAALLHLALGKKLFNGRAHPTNQQRIDALKQLNLG